MYENNKYYCSAKCYNEDDDFENPFEEAKQTSVREN